MTPTPTLLTPEEAAEIGRCSVKTVRRAYARGDLAAHRRRGSRAILLDKADVIAWANGELLQPTLPNLHDMQVVASTPRGRHLDARQRRPQTPASTQDPGRVNLSAAALRDRRATKTKALG
jgi:excisionase family DNA binding protein